MNISQHSFVPVDVKSSGYYNSSGQRQSSTTYNTTGILGYPQTPLVRNFIVFNWTSNKIRYWSSNVASSQTASGYSGDVGLPVEFDRNLVKFSIPDLIDRYTANCIMY